jgi:diguanylate cyclase (GGDEF)-like protein
VRGSDGKAIRMAGSISDITERKVTEEQIRFDALHDGLTELPNRTLLLNLLEHAVEQKKQHDDYNFALLLFDIDHFKFVNDSLGHQAGDELLIKIARKLKACLRSDCTPARLGGDEFAVLYDTGGGLTEVSRMAEQIQSALAEPFHIKEQEVFATISIGIVHNVAEYSRPEEIIRDAEIAMYRAKSAGRVRYEIFDANMHRQVVSRLKLESDLRRAIERHEFVLYYQPIVSLLSGQIAGFEALIRWQNADGVLVSPGDFIPLAEETGLIVEMDLWGLQQACEQLRDWNVRRAEFKLADTPLFVSVNLSRKLFTLPDLVPRIRAILEKASLEPGCLKLEITESAIVDNTQSAAATLHELKALGAQISIDDFGTGYSSLSYLHHFPLDVLKIDRSFINGMESDEGKHKIVWTIIAMARNLGMNVVAEGVEEHEQVQILQTLTCDFCQGYFFSKPLPREEAEALLKSAPRWSTPVDSLLDKSAVSLAPGSTSLTVQKTAI